MVTWGWLTTLPRVDRQTCTHRIKDGVVDRLTNLPRVDCRSWRKDEQKRARNGWPLYQEYDRPIHANIHDNDQFTYITLVLPRGSWSVDDVMDDRMKVVELGRPSDGFHTNDVRWWWLKGTGIPIPGRCLFLFFMFPTPRETETERHEMRIKALYFKHATSCLLSTRKGRNYSTGCRPVDGKNQGSNSELLFLLDLNLTLVVFRLDLKIFSGFCPSMIPNTKIPSQVENLNANAKTRT